MSSANGARSTLPAESLRTFADLSASRSESAWDLLVKAPTTTLYHVDRAGPMGIGATVAAGSEALSLLRTKLAPSGVFATRSSTAKAAALGESVTFAGGATRRVSGAAGSVVVAGGEGELRAMGWNCASRARKTMAPPINTAKTTAAAVQSTIRVRGPPTRGNSTSRRNGTLRVFVGEATRARMRAPGAPGIVESLTTTAPSN